MINCNDWLQQTSLITMEYFFLFHQNVIFIHSESFFLVLWSLQIYFTCFNLINYYWPILHLILAYSKPVIVLLFIFNWLTLIGIKNSLLFSNYWLNFNQLLIYCKPNIDLLIVTYSKPNIDLLIVTYSKPNSGLL